MEKLVIVINGKGGVGKDAMCDAIATAYKVQNISSITPIKEIAAAYGWQGEKTEAARRFLSDLKRAFTEYSDLPTKYLVAEYEKFLQSDAQILFVHIREASEIAKFVRETHTPCITLLVRRKAIDNLANYGNASDDLVSDYPYDHYFDNDLPLAESGAAFITLIDSIWKKMN